MQMEASVRVARAVSSSGESPRLTLRVSLPRQCVFCAFLPPWLGAGRPSRRRCWQAPGTFPERKGLAPAALRGLVPRRFEQNPTSSLRLESLLLQVKRGARLTPLRAKQKTLLGFSTNESFFSSGAAQGPRRWCCVSFSSLAQKQPLEVATRSFSAASGGSGDTERTRPTRSDTSSPTSSPASPSASWASPKRSASESAEKSARCFACNRRSADPALFSGNAILLLKNSVWNVKASLRTRVLLSVASLLAAKGLTIAAPVALASLVDFFNQQNAAVAAATSASAVSAELLVTGVPFSLVLSYPLARLGASCEFVLALSLEAEGVSPPRPRGAEPRFRRWKADGWETQASPSALAARALWPFVFSVFSELRGALFARVSQRASRELASAAFCRLQTTSTTNDQRVR